MEQRQTITVLESSPDQGLTQEQVQQRIAAGWVSGTPKPTGKSEKEILLTHIFTFFNLIFAVLAVLLVLSRSSVMNMGFLLVAVINTVIGIIQEIRAKRAVDRLTLVSARPVTVIRDGQRQQVGPEALVRDDIAEFGQGDQLCADGIVCQGTLWLDESLISGEADAVERGVGDTVRSGSVVLAGRGRVRLTAVGEDAFAARLSREAKGNPKARKSEMMRSLDKLILVVGIALVPVGLVLFYQEFFVLNLGFQGSVEGTVAALVGMIPEGLYLLTSIAMAASALKLSRSKVLVQDMSCMEALARVDVLCVDKTGTITQPEMQVENLIPLSGSQPEYLEAALGALYGGREPDNATARAIGELFPDPPDWREKRRIPFSPETKWSGAQFETAGAFVVGAPSAILGGRMEQLGQDVADWTAKGRRVLLLARYQGELRPGKLDEEQVKPLALLILNNPIRDTARETFDYFVQQGVSVRVISGDDPRTVSEIAGQAGIPGAERWVDCTTLDTPLDYAQAAAEKVVFGRVTPQQKRLLVQALQNQGHTVAMTGDGVNDLLAMKQADCSGGHGHGAVRLLHGQRSAGHEAGGLLRGHGLRRSGRQPAGQSGVAGVGFFRHAQDRGGGPPGDQQHPAGGYAVFGEEHLFPVPVGDHVVHRLALSLAAHAFDGDLCPDHWHSLVLPGHGAQLRPGHRAFSPGRAAPGLPRRADQCVCGAGVSGVYGCVFAPRPGGCHGMRRNPGRCGHDGSVSGVQAL